MGNEIIEKKTMTEDELNQTILDTTKKHLDELKSNILFFIRIHLE